VQFDDDHGPAERPGLNLTPMIDVIFLLIIFFMTVARLTTVASTAPVDLPEASQADAGTARPPGRVVVNVFDDGRIAFGDEVVTFEALRERLRRRPAGAAPALIRADRRAPLRVVKRVVRACVAAGADEIAFGAHPTGPTAPEDAP